MKNEGKKDLTSPISDLEKADPQVYNSEHPSLLHQYFSQLLKWDFYFCSM